MKGKDKTKFRRHKLRVMHCRIRISVFYSAFCQDCLSLYVSVTPGVLVAAQSNRLRLKS
jgi:hypothetical protein